MRKSLSFAVAILLSAPLGVAENEPGYPKEKVAEFVAKELDVTSLPSVFRFRKQKGKKTLADYGFKAREASAKARPSSKKAVEGSTWRSGLSQSSSEIYVCLAEPGENAAETRMQTLVFLKRKDSKASFNGRESSREFAACPVIGENGFAGGLQWGRLT